MDLILVRIVDQPQLKRIDIRCIGELIHRTFDRVHRFGPARGTHVAGRVLVELDEPLSEVDVCASIKQARPIAEIALEILKLRGHGDGIVPERN